MRGFCNRPIHKDRKIYAPHAWSYRNAYHRTMRILITKHELSVHIHHLSEYHILIDRPKDP